MYKSFLSDYKVLSVLPQLHKQLKQVPPQAVLDIGTTVTDIHLIPIGQYCSEAALMLHTTYELLRYKDEQIQQLKAEIDNARSEKAQKLRRTFMG